LDQDVVCITGIVIAELLQGSRTDEEAALLLAKTQPITFLEAPREAWVLTGQTAAALRRRGLTLPLSDVFLAAVAQFHGCAIYTTDAHFARIPHAKLFEP
jgi:predicted nucleic acid-binding protein